MLVWLACTGVPGAGAQQAAPQVVDLAPVVVSGVQPGPGMWRVTSAHGNVLWILGTVSPLPARLDWRADEVKAVIASADACWDRRAGRWMPMSAFSAVSLCCRRP